MSNKNRNENDMSLAVIFLIVFGLVVFGLSKLFFPIENPHFIALVMTLVILIVLACAVSLGITFFIYVTMDKPENDKTKNK